MTVLVERHSLMVDNHRVVNECWAKQRTPAGPVAVALQFAMLPVAFNTYGRASDTPQLVSHGP